MSRAYTKEEARKKFIKRIKHLAAYWAEEGDNKIDATEGMAFSMLSLIDGSNIDFPAMDIVLRPHSDDKEFCISEGENYYVDGMAINDDVQLHEEYVTKEK